MAQLRQDYEEFVQRNAVIVVLGPDGPNAFLKYWQENELPFIGLADIKSKVADLFYQEVNLLKLGRMPALLIIDTKGKIRFVHYGKSMSDIPTNEEVLMVLDSINNE
jgi:peroxiredoxin Q/BCP